MSSKHTPHILYFTYLFYSPAFSLTAWLNCRSLKLITINHNPCHRYEFPGPPLFSSFSAEEFMKCFAFLCGENVEDAVFRIGLHWGGVEYGWSNSGSWHINITTQRDSHFPPDRLGIGKPRQAGQRRLVWLRRNKRRATKRHAAQVGDGGELVSGPDECKPVRTFHLQ